MDDSDYDDENYKEEPSTEDEPALGKAELRRREFFRRARERSGYEHDWYIARRNQKKPLIFRTTGGSIKGLLGRFRIYDYEVKVSRIKDPLIVNKLDTFTICSAYDDNFLQKHIKVHRPTQDKKLEPEPGAGYNPPLTEGLVSGAIEGKKKLAMMMLDGRIIIGVPVNESLYSVLMKVPDIRGKELLCYKHGMAGCKLLEDIKGI